MKSALSSEPLATPAKPLGKKDTDFALKRLELQNMVRNLDIHTTLILQGVLLEHAMQLTGMRKRTILDI